MMGLAGFQLIKVLIVFDSAADLVFAFLNNENAAGIILEPASLQLDSEGTGGSLRICSPCLALCVCCLF